MNRSGFSIIKWQSSGTFTAFRKLFTTGGPNVMFGTKCPSITSTCKIVPPPSIACSASLPSCAKFDESIDGASSIFIARFPLLHPKQNYTLRPALLPMPNRQTVVSARLLVPRKTNDCHPEGIRRGCSKDLNLKWFTHFLSEHSHLHLSPRHRTSLRAALPHQLQAHHHPQRLLRRHLQFRFPQNCIPHIRIEIPPIPTRLYFPFPHIFSIHLGHFPKILRLLQHPRFPRPRRPRSQHGLQRVKLLLQIRPLRPHHHKSRP